MGWGFLGTFSSLFVVQHFKNTRGIPDIGSYERYHLYLTDFTSRKVEGEKKSVFSVSKRDSGIILTKEQGSGSLGSLRTKQPIQSRTSMINNSRRYRLCPDRVNKGKALSGQSK